MKSRHLAQLNESYLTHARHALWIAWKLTLAVLALLIHSIIPDILVTAASDKLAEVEAYRAKRAAEKEK